MKGMNQSSHLTEFLIKTGLIAAIAVTLLAPMSINANGNEAALRAAVSRRDPSWNALPLPPIRYLDTMRWLLRERSPKAFELDLLLGPAFEFTGSAVAASPAPSKEVSRNG